MSSLILGTVGSIVGGPIGGAVLSRMGQMMGGNGTHTGKTTENGGESSKKTEYQVAFQQMSSYGKMIPILYGTHRMAGNIIWAAAGAHKNTISIAIALCEGKIDEILHIWANNLLLDHWNVVWRFYKGTEDQMPDPFIESIEGMGNVPAYRGVAYVVIEHLNLEMCNYHLPFFMFEVKRTLKIEEYEGRSTEEMIRSMVIIPGAGEQVYDTLPHYKITGEDVGGQFIPQGMKTVVNMHNHSQKANVLVALDQLKETCPNVEWVSVVVTWFGTDMDIAKCNILPGVEYQKNATTIPDAWKVGHYTRDNAHVISLNDEGSPLYGGTPQDTSLLRLCEELHKRGYKILLYPMFFMDLPGKPWRGRVTGKGHAVQNFFTKKGGYNNFIMHYARLMQNKVEGFVIGSEMIGITSIKRGSSFSGLDNVMHMMSSDRELFPGVSNLVILAYEVRAVMGNTTLLTYAADWSEYHHTENGWYHLDPLWACDAIDRVGIDAYFPLIEHAEDQYDVKKIMQGWESGWHYQYYTENGLFDGEKKPLEPEYALKNIAHWWNNIHINPNGKQTSWKPQLKKIWFTEYGFPSVDGAASQPNVFYDPKSYEGALPYLSRGHMDIHAQRTAILGTEIFWKDSPMVERLFLWTWDARPFPFWPDFTPIWADGYAWSKGHWVQGKFGVSGLSAVVSDITERAGLTHYYDATRLKGIVEGFLVTKLSSARYLIEILQQAYFFDAVVSENTLKYSMRSDATPTRIKEENLLIKEEKESSREILTMTRVEENDIPRYIEISFYNPHDDYHIATEYAARRVHRNARHQHIALPLVFSPMRAKHIVQALLYEAWMGRVYYHFALPMDYAFFEPGDVIHLIRNSSEEKMRIIHTIHDVINGSCEIHAVREEPSIYRDSLIGTGMRELPINFIPFLPVKMITSIFWVFEVPAIFFEEQETADRTLYGAACGTEYGWEGAELFLIHEDSLHQDQKIAKIDNPSVMGHISGEKSYLFSHDITLTVSLLHGSLDYALDEEHMSYTHGKNFALIGGEIIRFEKATLVEPFKYTLSHITRELYGTPKAEKFIRERFILLDEKIIKLDKKFKNKEEVLIFKALSKHQMMKESESFSYALKARK